MERAAGFVHDDTPHAKLDKLDAVLAQTSTSTHDAALFDEMLSLANDGRYPVLELTSEQRRQRTLEALLSQIEALTRRNPVLMIFEDAHWTDPTTRRLRTRSTTRPNSRRIRGVCFRQVDRKSFYMANRDYESDLKLDPLATQRGRGGEGRDLVERTGQLRQGFNQRRAVQRPLSCFRRKACRFLDQASFGAVMRQQFRLVLGNFGELAFQSFSNARVQRAASFAQQRAIGSISMMSWRMLAGAAVLPAGTADRPQSDGLALIPTLAPACLPPQPRGHARTLADCRLARKARHIRAAARSR
jgi:hypothetical protein